MKKLLAITLALLATPALGQPLTAGQAISASAVNNAIAARASNTLSNVMTASEQSSQTQVICNVLCAHSYGPANTYSQHYFLHTSSTPGAFETGLQVEEYANSQSGVASNQTVDFLANMVAGPNAGSVWNQDNEIIFANGWGASGSSSNIFVGVGTESDIVNYSQHDYAPGDSRGNIFGYWLQMQGNAPSTVGLYIDGVTYDATTGAQNYGAHYGILVQGAYAVKDVDVNLSTNSTTSIAMYGNHTDGINLTNASISGAGIRMSQNQRLYFDNTGSFINYFSGGLRFTNAAGVEYMAMLDSVPTGATALEIWSAGNTPGEVNVSFEGPDTCGTGYRCLRVPN